MQLPMETLPLLPDLTAAGVSTEAFVEALISYARASTSATWVVRWNGRIRPIQGIGFFYSRESAHSAVVKWLRDAGRWCLSSNGAVRNRLAKNWSYKKAYREFIERLITHMEETGMIEYVELQPAAANAIRPPDAPQVLIG